MRIPNFFSSESFSNVMPSLKARSEPFPGINFVVMLGVTVFGFQSVTGFSKKREVDSIVEGGRNDNVILLKKPMSQIQTLTFKRGYRSRSLISSYLPITDLLFGDTALDYPGMPGTIFVLGRDRELRGLFAFRAQGIIEWTMSDLDAQSSVPLIETFTIAHEGLHNIGIPDVESIIEGVSVSKDNKSYEEKREQKRQEDKEAAERNKERRRREEEERQEAKRKDEERKEKEREDENKRKDEEAREEEEAAQRREREREEREERSREYEEERKEREEELYGEDKDEETEEENK